MLKPIDSNNGVLYSPSVTPQHGFLVYRSRGLFYLPHRIPDNQWCSSPTDLTAPPKGGLVSLSSRYRQEGRQTDSPQYTQPISGRLGLILRSCLPGQCPTPRLMLEHCESSPSCHQSTVKTYCVTQSRLLLGGP